MGGDLVEYYSSLSAANGDQMEVVSQWTTTFSLTVVAYFVVADISPEKCYWGVTF